MKWILLLVAVLAGLALVVLVVGLTRPADHVARMRAIYPVDITDLWATITDFEHWAEWNPDVESMTRLEDRNGHAAWLTSGGWGEMPTEIRLWEPPAKLETFVDGGSFQGTWTYELEPADGRTRLTVTERGTVGNPFFRGMLLFHDNYGSIRTFLSSLGTHLGGAPEPVRLP